MASALGPPIRRTLLLTIGALAVGYVGVHLALFVAQDRLLYPAPPPVERMADDFEVLDGRDADPPYFAAWLPGPKGAAVIVLLHGNGGQASSQLRPARKWHDRGYGVLVVEYPGYGPLHELEPSEAALRASAAAALDQLEARHGVGPKRLVLVGRSLGTGVATALAVSGYGGAVVLVSPFTSIPAAAASRYPWAIGVETLVRDRFDNLVRAGRVSQPTLVAHGDRDAMVPVDQGRAVAAALPDARLLVLDGAGHNDVFRWHDGVLIDEIDAFLHGVPGLIGADSATETTL